MLSRWILLAPLVAAMMPDDASSLNVFAADDYAQLETRAPKGNAMKLVRNMQGASFFDHWDFFNYPDPTHGQVNYVDQATARREKDPLAYVSKGNVILKVDAKSWTAPGANRDSVRITSKLPFVKGQLLSLAVKHMPTGCTTWPAFWTVGANWPSGGEIDIVENVNTATQNQYTLHTDDGCYTKTPIEATGQVLETNCYAYANGNTGCGIRDPRKYSFGAPANARGGGAYATLWNDDGISFWYFPKNKIPWDLRRARPDPSTWGRPVAHFAESACDTDRYFGNQTIVINTTLNGDWAGSPNVYAASGCPGSPSDYVQDPSHYKQAYWEIQSVRVYE